MIIGNILEAVGGTPLVKLQKIGKDLPPDIYVKAEHLNPGGSIKDRIAIKMVEEAEKRGDLKPGGTIIEGTSGNTGAGLALVGCIKGYKTIFTMPDKMSQAKIDYLRAFGAEVIICPTAVEPDDPRSYYSVAKKLNAEIPNSWYPNQYENMDNPATHVESTGPEIWEDMEGKIDVFLAGMGTGGTISGTGKYLKDKDPNIKIVGADPEGSVYLEYFKTGKMPKILTTYKVEGVGEDILPGTMDFDMVDDVVQVSDKESFLAARKLAKEEGIFCGGSSGTALAAALKYAEGMKKGQRMVVILPDHGDRYLSKVYNDVWMKENQFLTPSELISAVDIISARKAGPGKLVSVTPQDPMRKVVEIFRESDFSQVPVEENGTFVGCIQEEKIISFLLDHKDDDGQIKVEAMMGPPLPIVSAGADLEAIYELFRNGKPAVLVQTESSTNIITKSDLMHTFAKAHENAKV